MIKFITQYIIIKRLNKMNYQEQQRKIYNQDSLSNDYQWVTKNQYNKLLSGFVHKQNIKLQLSVSTPKTIFKIQQKLFLNDSRLRLGSSFITYNILNRHVQQSLKSFSNKFSQQESIIIGANQGQLHVELKQKQRQKFGLKFCSFIGVEIPKNLDQFNLAAGIIHQSKYANLLLRINANLMDDNTRNFQFNYQYCKNQIYFGLFSHFQSYFSSFQVKRALVGYQFTPKDFVYFKCKFDNLKNLISGRTTNQNVSFYYLRKINQNYKFGVGVKSINSGNHTLNFIGQMNSPHHIKLKIDTKFNMGLTYQKNIWDCFSVSYGIHLSNAFQKQYRVQSGLVFDYNV